MLKQRETVTAEAGAPPALFDSVDLLCRANSIPHPIWPVCSPCQDHVPAVSPKPIAAPAAISNNWIRLASSGLSVAADSSFFDGNDIARD